MLNQVPMQKVRFVQRHEVAALALHVVAAAAVVVELPLSIACFAIPILLELA